MARMPRFRYHIALTQTASFPAQLEIIEAADGDDALNKLMGSSLLTPAGAPNVWMRVIVSTHEDGSPKHVLSKSMEVRPTGELN
jgi:hypothetical protein